MVSFDVVSLFTSIPIELVRKSVLKHWDQISEHTPICVDIFWEIVEFCFDSSYFSFDRAYFKQKSGCAMGNPMSNPISTLVLEDLLDDAIHACSCTPLHVRKYVDDLFLLLPKNKVESINETFNSQHKNIQFTVETETIGRMPFLDMMLYRSEEGKITTDWYMKPIASGRFLNFHSFHPLHQKINVAVNFAKRVMKFSSHSGTIQANNIIRKQLSLNDYPMSLINRMINKSYEKTIPEEAMNENENTEKYIYRSLTNIENLTTQIIKTLHSDYKNTRVACKQTKTIGSLFPIVKDKTPYDENTNVIYKIKCKGTWKNNDENQEEDTQEENGEKCKACYIGLTSVKLKQRMSQHRCQTNELKRLWDLGYIKTDYPIAKLRQQTALLDHEIAMNHLFDIDGVRIIDRGDNQGKLRMLESCHIKTTKNAINIKKDTENIHPTYSNIFKTIQSINEDPKHRKQNKKTPPKTKHTTS